MISYKDRTFCGSATHKPDCEIAVTDELIKEAEEFGLPIAMADYCDDMPVGGENE